MIRIWVIALVALAACETVSNPQPLVGSWGGQHVGLIFEGGFGKLDYDCASGTIDEPIIPGAGGGFEADGRHIPGHGGPVRVGEIFVSKRAHYRGTVQQGVMNLGATLDDGTVIGPFTLRQGAQPQILRCL